MKYIKVAWWKTENSFRIGGVVSAVALGENDVAVLTLRLYNWLKVPTDSMGSVKYQGIIGDKFIQLSLGGGEKFLHQGSWFKIRDPH